MPNRQVLHSMQDPSGSDPRSSWHGCEGHQGCWRELVQLLSQVDQLAGRPGRRVRLQPYGVGSDESVPAW